MKKIFSAFVLLLVATMTFAEADPLIRKKITFAEKIQEAEIHGDISIVLTNDPGGSFYVEGQPGYVELVKIKTRKGKLIVSDHNKNRFFKTTIYISAADINSLTVNGNASISAEEVINTNSLLITLNGISVVKIASAKKGRIKVKAADGYELE